MKPTEKTKKLKTFKPKKTEYDKVIDALNLIDEQAEEGYGDYDTDVARSKAYDIVATFIDKHAKR